MSVGHVANPEFDVMEKKKKKKKKWSRICLLVPGSDGLPPRG